MRELKSLVQEVVDATMLCPEALQPMAFEILLRHQLQTDGSKERAPAGRSSAKAAADQEPEQETEKARQPDATPEDQESDEEISLRDLHAKTKKFLQDNSLTIQDLNTLYYKEATEIKPLYDDLRSTGMSESQIRLALLEAFETAMGTGNFEFSGESVREKCKIHKCYDSTNFTKNFRNNAPFFDGFESYEPATPIKLSPQGRKRLAAVVSELARST